MNKIKSPIPEEPMAEPVVEKVVEEKKDRDKSKSMVAIFLSSEWFSKNSAIGAMPFIIFLAMLGMFYIANRHYAERNIRQVEKINKELKELYWEHLNSSSDLMSQSKQTEVAKLTEVFGLKESTVPPKKIVIQE